MKLRNKWNPDNAPKVPKPEIKPPAQKPTKIMGQNTACDFGVIDISRSPISPFNANSPPFNANREFEILRELSEISKKFNTTIITTQREEIPEQPKPPKFGRKIIE